MVHLSFMKFYPADWLQDTRILSLETAGAWIDLICALWNSPTRGRIDWSLEQYAKFLRVDCSKVEAILGELEAAKTCDVTRYAKNDPSVTVTQGYAGSYAYVTLESRRIIRETKSYNTKRNQARVRMRRMRERRSNANVTQDVTRQTPDSRLRYKNLKKDSRQSSDDVTQAFSVADLVENWNECFAGKLPSVVLPLSHSRAVKAAARIREHQSFEFWESVFKRISASGFLLGSSNGNGWRATFDWLIANDRNCLKVFEGSYKR